MRIRLDDLNVARDLTPAEQGAARGGLTPRSSTSAAIYNWLLRQFGSQWNRRIPRLPPGLFRPAPSTGRQPCTVPVVWNGRVGFCE